MKNNIKNKDPISMYAIMYVKEENNDSLCISRYISEIKPEEDHLWGRGPSFHRQSFVPFSLLVHHSRVAAEGPTCCKLLLGLAFEMF